MKKKKQETTIKKQPTIIGHKDVEVTYFCPKRGQVTEVVKVKIYAPEEPTNSDLVPTKSYLEKLEEI